MRLEIGRSFQYAQPAPTRHVTTGNSALLRPERTRYFWPANPFSNRLPVRVFFGFKLSPSTVGVGDVAARHWRQGMDQKPAVHGLVEIHQFRDVLEVLARLLLGPEGASGRHLHQILGAGSRSMASVAAGVAWPSFQ